MDRLKNIDNAINIMLSEMETGWTNPDTLPLKQRLMRSLINIRQPDKPSQELIDAQDKELAAQREEKGMDDITCRKVEAWCYLCLSRSFFVSLRLHYFVAVTPKLDASRRVYDVINTSM